MDFHEDGGSIVCTRFEKNLIPISSLDKKGYIVAFIDGQVLMWSKGKTLEDVVVIGEEGGLYKLKGHPEQPLSMRSLAQVNYGIEGLLTLTTKNYPM